MKDLVILCGRDADKCAEATQALLDMGYHHGGSGWSKDLIEGKANKPGWCWDNVHTTGGSIEYDSYKVPHGVGNREIMDFFDLISKDGDGLSFDELF